MKQLIKNHQKEIEAYTQLDYERLQRITYLYEFDREIQLVLRTRATTRSFLLTISLDVHSGVTQQRMRTTGMPRQQTLFWPSGSPS